MTGLLEAIEQSGIATWVRESPSIFAYTLVLSLHAIGLSIVVGLSSIIGLRLVGKFSGIPVEPLLKLYPVMYFGFAINAISGLLLLMANATGMMTMFMFYLKMSFVVAAMIVLERMRRSFSNGTIAVDGRKLATMLLAFWFVAIITGRLTSYPYMIASWFGG